MSRNFTRTKRYVDEPSEDGHGSVKGKGFSPPISFPTQRSSMASQDEVLPEANPVQMFRAPANLKSTIADTTLAGANGPGEMDGFGATVGAGAAKRTWMTHVTWGGLDASGEGTRMETKPLGPDHPSGESSTKSDDQSKARQQFLTDLTHHSYIQGHFLNDNLGGSAQRRNLSAIPGKPGNSAHEKAVEKPIKALIDQNFWVYYLVDVAYQTKQVKDLNPYIQNHQIANLDGYNNLPGVKPVNRDSNIRLASQFACTWYTYQANGQRASAVNKVTIKFPHKVNQANNPINDDAYADAAAANGYDARFVEMPALTMLEQAVGGHDAVANNEAYLHLVKNVENTGATNVPVFTRDLITDIAVEQWDGEIAGCVDDVAEKLSYPDVHGGLTWEIADLSSERRISSRKRDTYLAKYKDPGGISVQDRWDEYKAWLINDKITRVEAAYAAITAPGNQTPALV